MKWTWILAAAAVLVIGFFGYWEQHRVQNPAPLQETAIQPATQESVLIELSSIGEVPPYLPSTMRSGVSVRTLEEFQQGMEEYQKRNYEEAIAPLLRAIQLNPQHSPSRFYLGIAQLKTHRVDEAIAQLSRLIEPDSNPYAEEAHWYLAKAYFGKKDLASGRQQLEAVVAMNRALTAEAEKALKLVASLETKEKGK